MVAREALQDLPSPPPAFVAFAQAWQAWQLGRPSDVRAEVPCAYHFRAAYIIAHNLALPGLQSFCRHAWWAGSGYGNARVTQT